MFINRFPDLSYSKKLTLADIPLPKDKYWSIVAYNQSKLCNLLFAMELNRRLKPKGVTCNAVHPGNLICTSLSKNSWLYWFFFLMARPFTKTSVRQAFKGLAKLENILRNNVVEGNVSQFGWAGNVVNADLAEQKMFLNQVKNKC